MLNAVKSQWGVLVEVEFLLTKFEEVNMKTTNCAYLDIASSTLLNELRSLKEMEIISTLKIRILKMTYKNKCLHLNFIYSVIKICFVSIVLIF